MLSSTLLLAALAPAAPVPPGSAAPAGPPPWVVWVKADPTGRVWLDLYKMQPVKQMRAVAETVDGKTVVKHVEVEVLQAVHHRADLAAAGARYATADGRPVATVEVLRRAHDGLVVLASADGQAVGPGWLRAADPDAVVLVAADLAGAVRLLPTARAGTPAPRLLLLGAGADGVVRAAYHPNPDGANPGRRVINVTADGRAVYADGSAGVPGGGPLPTKPLAELPFDAFDRDGGRVARADVVARLRAGGLVLVAGDGRVPDPVFRQAFRADLLVLASAELAAVPADVGATKAAALGAVMAPAPAVVQAVRVAPIKMVAPAPVPAANPETAPPPRPAKSSQRP